MTDATQLTDRYIASCKASDPEGRRDLIAGAWIEGGPSVIEGIDIGVVADDGRLASITGFLDKVP